MDVELDEGAGQLLGLPRRGLLARAQADHRIADPHCLARLELDLARQAVALVEEADHRLALRHRRRLRRPGIAGLRRFLDLDHGRRRGDGRIAGGYGVVRRGRARSGAIIVLERYRALPGSDAQPGGRGCDGDAAHDQASGVHAS
ncbi:hypothetical protein NX02_06705 [Sphingomonas sanxanigenens DSM 19645 = NX02]|uniref:Uncharacterized protein n=1 Tax=Sphingomonas sanxanigenens DSM 19645 = NX02 TaxID=1123269 RepID=W0A7K5_9SPHN|nr:hypothetical protein NX02_06705 [Sphingomonas sanxanigenens DSM 19645 = NX02]